MYEPKPGDVAIKDGIEVTVHFVADGQVYAVRYREGASDESLEWGEIPEGCLGAFRTTLDNWHEQISGARYVPVTT